MTLELKFDLPALGDVASDGEHARHPMLRVVQRAARDGQRARTEQGRDDVVFAGRRPAGSHHLVVDGGKGLRLTSRQEIASGASDHGGRVDAMQATGFAVEQPVASFAILGEDEVGRLVCDGAEQFEIAEALAVRLVALAQDCKFAAVAPAQQGDRHGDKAERADGSPQQ